MFLAAVGLITSSVILTELALSYPELILPQDHSVSKEELEIAEIGLQNIEWHTRIQASALAFGAFVFLWYKLFIFVLNLVVRAWRLTGCIRTRDSVAAADGDHDEKVGRSAGNSRSVGDESNSRFSCRRSSQLHRSVTILLLGVIILNDSIYNQCRGDSDPTSFSSVTVDSFPLPLSHLLTSYSANIDLIRFIPPGALSRLIFMASRSFPVCAAEVSVLFLVLYAIGFFRHHRSTVVNSRLESGLPESQDSSHTTTLKDSTRL
jgi:hypothetical protein